jgi:flagellar hook-length control protein FliK
MSITTLPPICLEILTATPVQEPVSEALPSGLVGSDALKSYLLKPFDQSLQDSLETNQEVQPLSAWFLLAPVAESSPLAIPSLPPGWQSGKPLPASGVSGGKDLPQLQNLTQPGELAQPDKVISKLIKDAGIASAVQADSLQAAQVKLAERFEGIGESMQQAVDGRTAGHLTGQYATVGSHTDITPSAPRAALPLLSVDAPLGQPDWGKAVGERIQWMLGKHLQEAELKLNPPHLGPLEVRISLQQDQANVSFLATQAPTREALEAALPRLREMFGEANLSLIDVDVGQRDGSQQQSSRAGVSAGHTSSEGAAAGESAAVPNNTVIRQAGSGMVDDYA